MSPAPPSSPQDPSAEAAGEPLFEEVYEDLRELASGLFRKRGPAHTLQPTALVHEVWLKVAERGITDRQHFLALAAKAMRQILIDHARRARADKRGGGAHRVTLEAEAEVGSDSGADLVALDDALTKLGRANPRFLRVFELRFLAGMGSDEVAETLGVTQRTAQLDWRAIRAFLQRELLGDSPAE